MCLAVPIQVGRIENEIAWVSDGVAERPVSLLGVDGVAPGDFLLVHAGIALAKLDPDEVEQILTTLEAIAVLGTAEEVSE
jgi:hydrogenase expression/formation protein HypC